MAQPVQKMAFGAGFTEIIDEETSQSHVEFLKSLTNALRVQEFRDNVEDDVFKGLEMVLGKMSTELKDHECDPKPTCLEVITECFRSLRNSCAQCFNNQNRLRELGFIERVVEILSTLNVHRRQREPQHFYDALRCGVQFLGNIAVKNQNGKDDIWKHGFPVLFLDLLDASDEKLIAYTCMALHTCLDELKLEQLSKQEASFEAVLKVIQLCRTQPEVEWTILMVTEHFFRSQELIEKMYSTMNPEDRLTVLELMAAQLVEGQECEQTAVLPATADFLAVRFKEDCKAVLLLGSGSCLDDEEAIIVVRLLDILCELSSGHKDFTFLQNSKDLLEASLALLKEVHLLGKESGSVFSSAQDFSGVRAEGGDDSCPHPAVSFKAHLVRLIGNLCHRNPSNQNKVRELDGIALILDNCCIDSNNPFISQWAVLALRNILESNMENQAVVQGLKMQGVTDDSALRDMGFRLEERDGSLMLRPLKKDNQSD